MSILNHCLSDNLFSPSQFGFLPHHSTSLHSSLPLIHSTCPLLKTNKTIRACFLDLRRAFDSVPHAPLLQLLLTINCPPLGLNWLHSYLADCTQRVVVSVSTSSPLLTPTGV